MLIIVEAGHVGTWELTTPLSLLFHIFGKVRNKSSGKSQRQFLLLWRNLCGALLQVGKLTAPDASQEEPQDRVLPSSLSSVWEQSAKTNLAPAQGSRVWLELCGALWLFPVLGREERGSPLVGGSHKASITLHFPRLPLPGPGSGDPGGPGQDTWGGPASHRGSHREPCSL